MPQKAQRADIVSVALFRDGASACVLGDGGVHADETAHYEVITGRSRIVPDTRGLVDYKEEDGGSIHLHIDKKLPDAIGRAEPAFVETLLHEAELLGHQPPDIEGFDVACHTGGPRVLHEVASALGAADEQLASSWAVMKARGNLSGASNLAVLDHLNRATAESARPLDVYAQRALPTFDLIHRAICSLWIVLPALLTTASAAMCQVPRVGSPAHASPRSPQPPPPSVGNGCSPCRWARARASRGSFSVDPPRSRRCSRPPRGASRWARPSCRHAPAR